MNGRYENIRYYTPFQLFNPHRNGLKAFESKNIIKNNFSEIGYQIMNPQYINYHLEPIYSLIPNITKSNISRIKTALVDRELIDITCDSIYMEGPVFSIWMKTL